MMDISTKKGDSGYTSLLRGARVPKHHLIIEAGGSLDEANSLLGLARASSKEKRIKRIILQVQKHLFTMGAEFSIPKGGTNSLKKRISEQDVKWLERLVEVFEESLALPPGFVAFGQEEGSSHLDVARTSVRKVERMTTKLKSENMIENPFILKYLNRLSDLIFLLACFEEKDYEEKREINRTLFSPKGATPFIQKWAIVIGLTTLVLIAAVIFLLLFHNATPRATYRSMDKHMERIENMQKSIGN